MPSSIAFILFLEPNNVWSTQDMSPARTIQLTNHPEENIHLFHILCPTYPSPQSYTNSSQTLTQSSPLQTLVSTSQQTSYPSPTTCFPTMNVPQSMQSLITGERISLLAPPTARKEQCAWNMQIPTLPTRKHQMLVLYHKNLSPLLLPLRPHCPAGPRLRLWHLLIPHSLKSPQVSDDDLKYIEAVIAHAWEPDAHTMYASGLLNYMVFCDKRIYPRQTGPLPVSSYSCLLSRHSQQLTLGQQQATMSVEFRHGI